MTIDHREPRPELYGVPWTTDQFNGMPYRFLGSSGLRVSNVGLGTWKFGYPETDDGSRVDEGSALQLLDRAIHLGVTFWDTANRYNDASGNSERVIGTWMERNPDQRRNVVLATKLFGGMDGVTPNHSRLSRTNILESVYASLERLVVDHIDLLYFHAYDEVTPMEESLAAVEDLARQDLVRYFGVSNFTLDQVSAYRRATVADSISRCRVVAVQNRFDVLNGESEQHPGVLAYAAREGISFVAHGPLAQGLLSDRYLDLSRTGPGDRLYDEGNLEEGIDEPVMAQVKELARLADGWDIELSQLVLAYTLALPGMGPVIPGASSIEQLESNAAAGRITLDEGQRARIQSTLAATDTSRTEAQRLNPG